MNAVVQLWSKVSNYYRTLNPATLSGAIDVIVVVQHDGSLKSSPFHARFGKSGILRPQENVVDLYVNGELVPDIQMKLGEAGEAFFLDDPPPQPELVLPAVVQDDGPRLQVAGDYAGAESGDDDSSRCSVSETGQSGNQLTPPSGATLVSYYSDCEGDERPCTSNSRRSTLTGYKSDSESDAAHSSGPQAVIGGAADQLVAQLDWEWGQLPHSATMDSVKSGDYFDCCSEDQTPPASAAAAAAAGAAKNGAEATSIKLSGELVSSEKLNRIIEERLGSSHSHSQPQPVQGAPQFSPGTSERERLSSSGECYLSDLDDTNRHLYLSGSPSSPESGYKSDQDLSNVEEDLNVGVQLSLCGGLDLPNSITTERFLKHLISFEEYVANPEIIEHKDLVVRIQGKNYNWRTAAPILLCRASFGAPLPYRTVQSLKERHMRFRRKRNMMRSWFGWRNPSDDVEPPEDPGNDEDTVSGSTPTVLDIKESVAMEDESKQQSNVRQFVRTVRLSSDQLKKLNLRPGYNELKYSITTKYQGTTECTCGAYLWSHDDRIVISDIDGTITKSDVLGHILPMVGKDWTQPRITKLFSAIERNDYRFVYLSARAIGQSAVTRRFLHQVRQEGVTLPDGPVLLSPLSLMRAFHQEVIARRPEAFKIACLRDVRALFPEDSQPFWAGFGNRPSDALSYTEVGIGQTRCFTVNPQGEVTKASGGGDCLPLSYQALADIADMVFPPFQHCFADHGNFSHFAYWRDPLPELAAATAPDVASTPADAASATADAGAGEDSSLVAKIPLLA